MAEDKDKDGAPPADKDKDTPPAGGPDRATIAEMVREIIGTGSKPKPPGEPDIAAQVEAAVKKVQDRDARSKKEQDRDARLAALEEKTAKPEKTPKAFRAVERFMGWGRDDDGE